MIEGVHGDRRALAGAHAFELRLLEVGDHPHVGEARDGHQRLSGLHDLAQFDGPAADDAVGGRADDGAVQVDARLIHGRARLPLEAALLRTGTPARVLVAVGEEAPAARVAGLASAGATVLQCKSHDGRVDVRDLCARLLGLDVMAVLLEGGSALTGAFVQARLVDRVAVFVAPKLLGGETAPGPAGGPGRLLPEALRLGRLTARPVGEDWLLEGSIEH